VGRARRGVAKNGRLVAGGRVCGGEYARPEKLPPTPPPPREWMGCLILRLRQGGGDWGLEWREENRCSAREVEGGGAALLGTLI
jgi:hypothetical protein